MSHTILIDQELSAAQVAWKEGNEGKARVCARRAVALAAESWLAHKAEPLWRRDAMEHLRRIQAEPSIPFPIRQAAERLATAVTRQHDAPFTVDPISDANIIIAHLTAETKGARLP